MTTSAEEILAPGERRMLAILTAYAALHAAIAELAEVGLIDPEDPELVPIHDAMERIHALGIGARADALLRSFGRDESADALARSYAIERQERDAESYADGLAAGLGSAGAMDAMDEEPDRAEFDRDAVDAAFRARFGGGEE